VCISTRWLGVTACGRRASERGDYQPALQLVLRDIRHAVIGVIQIKDLFQTKRAGHFGIVALVAET
jgi:hypothetical protein